MTERFRAARSFLVALGMCAIAMGAIVPRTAHAEDPPTRLTARELYDGARKAYDAKQFGDAARGFLAADALAPNAVALEMAMRCAEAIDDPLLALDIELRAKDRTLDPELMARIAQAAERARPRTARLYVSCTTPSGAKPKDCSLRVDAGGWVDSTVLVMPGVHVVDLRSGDTSERRTQSIGAGDVMTLKLTVPEPQNGLDGGVAGLPPTVTITERPSPAWFYVAGGVTLVAGGLTLASRLDSDAIHRKWLDSQDPGDRDRGMAADTRTNVALAVTGGVALTTLVLAIITRPWESRPTASSSQTARLR